MEEKGKCILQPYILFYGKKSEFISSVLTTFVCTHEIQDKYIYKRKEILIIKTKSTPSWCA